MFNLINCLFLDKKEYNTFHFYYTRNVIHFCSLFLIVFTIFVISFNFSIETNKQKKTSVVVFIKQPNVFKT